MPLFKQRSGQEFIKTALVYLYETAPHPFEVAQRHAAPFRRRRHGRGAS